MESARYKGLFASLLLAAAVGLVVIFIWEATFGFALYLTNYFTPDDLALSWWKFLLLVALALVSGYLAENLNARRLVPFAASFIAVWGAFSFVAAKYFSTNLLFSRVAFIVVFAMLAVHCKKLWLIDSELTEKLVELASEGHVLEGRPAEMRIESGLKLLETILPLSEAILFRLEGNGELRPVGRARSSHSTDSLIRRQIAWRESISLCERALEARVTVIESDETEEKSAQVALPLLYEGAAVGVLFVKVHRDFERADQHALEAFAGQMARNFQRKELRGKDLPNKFWWSFLSVNSLENRVGTTSLIKSLMKEQSFSAVASSYLKEAHAIAYLDGTLAYLNRQMRHLAGVNSQQIPGLDLFGLLAHFRTDAFQEPELSIRRVLQTGESYRNELFFNGSGRTLDLQISLVKTPSDEVSIHETNVATKPACLLITLRDITAVKENERLRSDMTRLMSHELRTPVTSIKGFAELLLMDPQMSEENREFLTIIANESQRLSKMLSTFLSVANLEQSDQKDVTKTAVKLDSVVREVVGEFQETARRKRIRLVEETDAQIPPVAADQGLIRRAISNLLDNAIKYSPERTSVLISTMLEADFLRVTVEDRGYGIDRTEHEKIWQKFYRVAREGQDKDEDSTGLGLALVKEIVEQHGGEVELESEIGQGSKFSFRLPRL